MNDILGGSQVLGLLSPELQAQAEQRARSAGLTNLGFALLQASQGQPGQRRPGLGQIIGQAGPVGLQAYQQSFDRTLQDMLRAQQIQDLQKQRAQREQQELARQRFAQQFAPVTPQTALQAPGQVGPTAARAAMIGQTPALDRSQLLSAILDPNMPPDVFERAKAVYEATAPAKEPESITKLRILEKEPQLAETERGLRAAGAPTTNLTVQNALGKTFGESLGQTLKGIKGLAKPAYDTLATIDNMQTLLDQGVRTGFGQEAVLQFQRAGQAFNPDYKVKEIAGQESFVGAANQIILPQVKLLGVNPTDKDLDFIVKGSPSLGKSVAGNQLMLSGLKLKFERDKALAQFATQWQISNADLITSQPVIAEARFDEAMQQFMQTSPLYTTEVNRLRNQYSQILGGQPASLTQGSPFRK
jgi:hypothetical protein